MNERTGAIMGPNSRQNRVTPVKRDRIIADLEAVAEKHNLSLRTITTMGRLEARAWARSNAAEVSA